MTQLMQRRARFSPTARHPEAGGEQAPLAAPLAVVVTAALLVLMQLYVAIPLAPILGEQLGSGSAAAVALNTAYGLAYGAGFVIWGPVSDRFGRKAVLVPGMTALAVATAGMAAAPSLGIVGVLRAAQGLVAASFAAVALAYIGEALPPRARSVGIGAVSTAFLAAGIVGQVYAQGVAQTWGWRPVFALAALAFVFVAIALAAMLPEPPRNVEQTLVPLGRRYAQLTGLLTRRDLVMPYAAALTVLLSFVAMYAGLGPHLAGFGLDQTDVLWVRLAGLPGMLLAPFAGALAGRFGSVRVAVGGLLCAATGLIAQAGVAGTVGALVVASVVFVAGIATTVPALITMVGDRAGQARAAGIGLYGLVLFAGASLGPQVAALPVEFAALLTVLAALLVLAAGLVMLSRR
ncbi:MAG TPA: MFS transporter [Jiangellaceae bacterium]|nr:MFS transporter [Jiangellaceae bacterium]